MKKIHIIKTILSALCVIFFASCVDDSIDQNYSELNELILKIEKQRALQAPENANDSILVKVVPEIILPEGLSRNNLSFEWRIQTEKNYATVWEIYSITDTLVFFVKSDTKNTFFRFGVTDNKLGITTYQEFTIKILKPFEDNWFVLQNIGGKSVLGSVEAPGENPLITTDILMKKYQKPLPLSGTPKALTYCFNKESGNSPSEWRLQILTDKDGALYNSKSLAESVYTYEDLLIPRINAGSAQPIFSYAHQQGEIIIDNGNLYYSAEDGAYIYFKCKPHKDIKDATITHATTFEVKYTSDSYLMAFDNKNKQFLFCKTYIYPGAGELVRKSPNLTDVIYGSSSFVNLILQKVPNYTDSGHPNKFNPELSKNHEILFMDNWYDGNVVAFTYNKADGKTHIYDFSSSAAEKKDTSLCLAERTCILEGNPQDARIAVSNAYKNIFFYATGNKVYRVDLNRSTAKTILIYEHPDATAHINIMKFRHPNFASMVDTDGDDTAETSLDQMYTLGLAIEKRGKWSVSEIYLTASGDVEKDDEKNPKVYEYDGFSEIIDIVYTFACKWW